MNSIWHTYKFQIKINIYYISCHYKVNISNGKADTNETNVFLNS